MNVYRNSACIGSENCVCANRGGVAMNVYRNSACIGSENCVCAHPTSAGIAIFFYAIANRHHA